MHIEDNQAFDITHTIKFKTITTIKTSYNTELFGQELTTKKLPELSGGDSDSKRFRCGEKPGDWDYG